MEGEGEENSEAEGRGDTDPPLKDRDGDCENMALCVPPPAPAERLFELMTLEVGLEPLERVAPRLNEATTEPLPARDSVALPHPVPLMGEGVIGADTVPAKLEAEPMLDAEKEKKGGGVPEAVPDSDCNGEVVVMGDTDQPLLEEAVEEGDSVPPALKVPPPHPTSNTGGIGGGVRHGPPG